jgi:two-component system CheB/CheR fusion protein
VSHQEGNATFNILKITRPEIALELRHTIAKAIKTKQPVRRADIELKINDVIRNISIEVVPLKAEDSDPLFLVVFIEQHRTEIIAGAGSEIKTNPVVLHRKLKKLEEELAHSRDNMLAYSLEQEAFTEELQSANEESVSSNEELQTLNEELATSKEEIESALEELNTTNQELQTRNDQLIEIQRYSETIIATVPLPLVILDRDLRVKSANKAFYKKFLVTQEHTEKNRLYDLGNHQWNIPALRTLLEEIIPDNTTFTDYCVEHNFEHIGEKVMLLNAKQIEIEKEKLILLAISDITEHSKAQVIETQALEESISAQKEIAKALKFADEYIRNVFMQAPSAIVVYKGPSFIVDLVNEKALEMWGTAYENTIHQPLFKIMPQLYQSLEKLLTNVYLSGEPYIANELYIPFTRNGKKEEGVFNIVLNPFRDVNGTIIGITSMSTDVTPEVTARKRIEETEILFQFIADSMPQKVWTADTEGKRNYFNKQWLDYTGLSLEELKNEGWKKIVHPHDLPNTEKRWQEALETGNDFETEDRKLNNEGSYKWHLTRAAAFRDDTGVIKMWIGTNTEVEKQKMKALEFENAVKDRTKELEHANEELQKMNKELESFTYVSSHDLQEPLRKIQTFTTRILEKESQNLSDQGKDYFRRMQEAAKRMQTLIQDLLAFSRINSGERQFEPTDLINIVEEVKKDLKEAIEEKQAIIETKELSGQVLIIPFQFRQLMHNLISNALKFSKPGVPPLITIKSEILASYLPFEGQACHITIADTGIGFEQHFADQIFEVFQKLHGKDEYPGTGIGLAIVKKIINNHNGTITATSKLRKGTTFDIYIPC